MFKLNLAESNIFSFRLLLKISVYFKEFCKKWIFYNFEYFLCFDKKIINLIINFFIISKGLKGLFVNF